MTRWLTRVALWVVPRSWRDTVQADLEDEARAEGRGLLWSVWQTVRLAVPLRWVVSGGAAWFDLRYAWRSLRSAPVFAATAAITFALGIGVNVAVFSAVDRMLFRPLPYVDVDRLVFLRNCVGGGLCAGSFPSPIAFELQKRSATIEALAIVGQAERFYTSPDQDVDQPLTMLQMSPRLFSVLGVRPVLGRDATDADETARQRLAWLSHETWTARFNAAPDVLGRRIWIGQQTAEIIGVLPRGFIPPAQSQQVARWHGLVLDYAGRAAINPAGITYVPVVRLRPGATREAVTAEVGSLVAALFPVRSGGPPQPTIRVDPVIGAMFSLYRANLWLVVAAAAAVLLVAAANLSTLLLVRARSRAQTGAIAVALGASRGRLARVALCESAILCAAGTMGTLIALAAASGTLRSLLPPIFDHYAANLGEARVLTFALVVATAASLLAGVWPAMRASRVDIRTLLQSTSRTGRARTVGSRSLLALEAALGTALVVGGAMCVRSFAAMVREDLGYVPKDLYAIGISPPKRAAPEPAALAWYGDALEALKTIPGVTSVGGADVVVGSGALPMRGFSDVYPDLGGRFQITDNYFETIGTRFLAGRSFTAAEVRAAANVAILNDTAAGLVWPGEAPTSAVGRILELSGDPAREVVGIVPALKTWRDTRAPAALYLPKAAEHPAVFNAAVVRMEPQRPLDVSAVRTALSQRVGDARIDVSHVAATLEPFMVDPRFRAALLGTLALTGLILAAVGLYAVASADVALRRYETGVRLALGATVRNVSRRVIVDTCQPVLLGVAAGLMVSYWSAQYLQAFLRRVDARDPWTYALVALTLIATAVASAWLPARRAASTDPAAVLRAQ